MYKCTWNKCFWFKVDVGHFQAESNDFNNDYKYWGKNSKTIFSVMVIYTEIIFCLIFHVIEEKLLKSYRIRKYYNESVNKNLTVEWIYLQYFSYQKILMISHFNTLKSTFKKAHKSKIYTIMFWSPT